MEKLSVEITADASPFVRGANAAINEVQRLNSAFNKAGGQNQRLWATMGKEASIGARLLSGSLDQLGGKLTSVGSKMAVGFTLPLALLSGAAFKAYGDIDALRLGLENIEGSTAGAAARFAELREVAKLPGLGLAEAIKGDTRLRALGFSAKESKRSLLEFGNALALTGGGKTELDNVLTQLTQMASKSSVLTEDLKPIINAGPAIAAAVKNLFGTVNAEEISSKLQAAGKGPKDFVNELVNELSKLERIKGGPKNALENFGDNVKIASYEFMKAADSSLGLTSKLEGLGNMIGEVATGFTQLPGFVQGSIFVVTGLAASIGPLILAVGSFIQLLPTLQKGLQAIQVGMAALVSPMGLFNLGVAAAAVALGTLIYSVWQYNEAIDASMDKSKLAASVNAQVEQSIGAEKARLESLIKVAKDENQTKDARLKSIKEINDISPKYLGNLSLETIGTQSATKAINEYVQAMTLRARQMALFNTIQEKQAQLAAERGKSTSDYGGFTDYIGAFITEDPTAPLGDVVNEKRLGRQARSVNVLMDEIDQLTKEAEQATAQLAKMGETGGGGKSGGFLGGMTNALDDARIKLKKLGDEIALDKFNKVVTPSGKIAEFTALKKQIEDADSVLKDPKKSKKAQSLSEYWENELKLVREKIANFKASNIGIPVPEVHQAREREAMNKLGTLEKTELPDVERAKSVSERYWKAVANDWYTAMQRQFKARADDIPRTLDALWESANRAGQKGQDQKRAKGEFNNVDANIQGQGILSDLKYVQNQIKESGTLGAAIAGFFDTDAIQAAFDKGKIGVAGLKVISDNMQKAMDGLTTGLREVGGAAFAGFFETMGASLAGSKNAFQKFGNSILNMIADLALQIGKSMLMVAGAMALAGIVTPYLAAGIAITVAGGAIKALASKNQSVPAMANGGLAYGPQLTMIGDNPNARFDPEMVAPASDIVSLVRAAASGGGGTGGRVEFEIRGSSLIGVLDNAKEAQYNNL